MLLIKKKVTVMEFGKSDIMGRRPDWEFSWDSLIVGRYTYKYSLIFRGKIWLERKICEVLNN